MLHSKLIRFLFVGSFCSFVFIASANLIYGCFGNEWISTIVSNGLGILCGYCLQMRLTFQTKGRQLQRFRRYVILSFLILLYSQSITWLFQGWVAYWLITCLIALSIPFFSYPLQKYWIFGD